MCKSQRPPFDRWFFHAKLIGIHPSNIAWNPLLVQIFNPAISAGTYHGQRAATLVLCNINWFSYLCRERGRYATLLKRVFYVATFSLIGFVEHQGGNTMLSLCGDVTNQWCELYNWRCVVFFIIGYVSGNTGQQCGFHRWVHLVYKLRISITSVHKHYLYSEVAEYWLFWLVLGARHFSSCRTAVCDCYE